MAESIIKNDGWKYVGETYGNTAVSLPSSWKELYILCRYGNSSGLQAQAVPIHAIWQVPNNTSLSVTGTIATQVTVSSSKATMSYFGVSGTNYTSTSKMYVYYK